MSYRDPYTYNPDDDSDEYEDMMQGMDSDDEEDDNDEDHDKNVLREVDFLKNMFFLLKNTL